MSMGEREAVMGLITMLIVLALFLYNALLYATLLQEGFATGRYDRRPVHLIDQYAFGLGDDGLSGSFCDAVAPLPPPRGGRDRQAGDAGRASGRGHGAQRRAAPLAQLADDVGDHRPEVQVLVGVEVVDLHPRSFDRVELGGELATQVVGIDPSAGDTC